jgi:hypothetical protein
MTVRSFRVEYRPNTRGVTTFLLSVGDALVDRWWISVEVDYYGESTGRHSVPATAIPAVLGVPEYWERMRGAGDVEQVRAALVRLGFVEQVPQLVGGGR